MTRSALYRGALVHVRRAHPARTFRYPLHVAALDLDELPALDRALRLFSLGRRNLFGFDARDYGAGATDLRAPLADLLATNGLPAPATTRLITNLRAFGHVFNPVSFFLHYDAAGALTSVVAEVNNTYGGRLRYLLGPRERVPHATRAVFRHVRELFVSPFLHGPRTYTFAFDAPLDAPHLAITMHVDTPAGAHVFTAHLTGARTPLTDRALAAEALRFPFAAARVLGLIHYEALKLRLLGTPYRRPGRDHRPLPESR